MTRSLVCVAPAQSKGRDSLTTCGPTATRDQRFNPRDALFPPYDHGNIPAGPMRSAPNSLRSRLMFRLSDRMSR